MRKPRLAIYARTSVDKDEFNKSIEQQIEAGKEFAKENNFDNMEVIKWIIIKTLRLKREQFEYIKYIKKES